jgi:hypothetical protein
MKIGTSRENSTATFGEEGKCGYKEKVVSNAGLPPLALGRPKK